MKRFLVIAMFSLLACVSAMADPGYYLITVYENEGKANLDFRYWTVKNKGAGEVVWPEVGVGYGVTKRWYTELLASSIGSGTMATKPSSLNWQNDFMLTQGQYDVDVALHTNLIHNYDRTGSRAVEFGPVMQTEVGPACVSERENLYPARPHVVHAPAIRVLGLATARQPSTARCGGLVERLAGRGANGLRLAGHLARSHQGPWAVFSAHEARHGGPAKRRRRSKRGTRCFGFVPQTVGHDSRFRLSFGHRSNSWVLVTS